MSVIDEVAAERRRQVDAEGWSPDHDDGHRNGEMALAAAAYTFNSVSHVGPTAYINFSFRRQPMGQFDLATLIWPWEWRWWKPIDRRRDLVKAAALIVAEIERLDRAEKRNAA